MSLLPQEARFEELVQDCFLAFRGAGVMLSPLDAELLSQWAAQNVPYEVVARGIRRAAERALWDARPDEPSLKSLRACRREVNAEIKKYLDRAAGMTEADPEAQPKLSLEESRHRKLRGAVKKWGKSAPAFSGAVARLLDGPLAAPPQGLPELARREEVVMATLARALPFSERAALTRQVRATLREAAPSLSARARSLSRRFHRAALLRKKLDLPPFW